MKILSNIFLLPFTGIYALIILIRNHAYKKGWFKATPFEVPIISIGNLNTGGTGKTPHTEYLIKYIKQSYPVGVLSRGYKRKTNGYKLAQTTSTAAQVGDEPLLLKWKHPNVQVAVSEDRVTGIPALTTEFEGHKVILLDDAFQHRAIQPGISIILTEYNNLFVDDYLLPLGRLREFKSGYKRADLIIVTKSPENLSSEAKNKIIQRIQPTSYQYVFFSSIKYGNIYPVFEREVAPIQKSENILLLTGIANPKPMKVYLAKFFENIFERNFQDHHLFTESDIESILTTLKGLDGGARTIITTEKDATRLFPFAKLFKENGIDVFCLPISVNFASEEQQRFHKAIDLYLNHSIPKEEDEYKENN